MGSEFFLASEEVDPAYKFVRDTPSCEQHRNRLIEMWREYEPHCPDPNFRELACRNFEGLVWQMHIALLLVKGGFELQKPNSHGPDILTHLGGRRVWIEAVAVTAGNKSNQVYGIGRVGSHRKEPILLRLLSQIKDKYEKYQTWVNDGIVSSQDVFMIAINAGRVPNAYLRLDWEVPMIVNALCGIGEPWERIDVETGQVIESGYTFRPSIKKPSGASVPTVSFCNNLYKGISAILYSPDNYLNYHSCAGRDLEMVHNPFAANIFPKSIFKFGREYCSTNEQLEILDWRSGKG